MDAPGLLNGLGHYLGLNDKALQLALKGLLL
jgi:hypothetical protein